MTERLYPVVYDFLVSCGFSKTASKCLKEMKKTEADLKTSENLIKLYQVYLNKSKSAVTVVKSTGVKRKASKEESDSESDSDSEESEPVKKVDKKEVATKKSPKEVKKVVESSDESSEEESEEEEEDDDSEEDSSDEEADNAATLARIKLKEEERKKKAVEASEAAAAWTERASMSPTPRNVKPKGPRVSGEAFRRVDDEIWSKEIIEGLEDNSYAKAFGVDGYGAKASEKLMTVRGKDFRHEKTKKKRGSYRGGSITMDSNSFKYD